MSKRKQISLFHGTEEAYREIKKHSSLVQMGSVSTLLQRRLMNVSIWITRDHLKRKPNQTIFWTEIGILKRLAGFKDSDNEHLKEALRSLRRTEFEYNIFNKDSQDWGNFSYFSDVQIKTQGRGKQTNVFREFPTRVLNVVKDPNMFVRLNLLILHGLNSKHSVVLYELLKDYVGIKNFRCSPDDFRKIMGIKAHQYKSFSMLVLRVIEVAVKEINEKTDLEVSREVEKIGNRPVSICFHMSRKKKSLLIWPDNREITKRLAAFGIQEKQIKKLLSIHDTQYLLANIAVVEEKIKQGDKIKNVPAYLMKAFEVDYTPKETEYTEVQKKQAEEKQAAIEQEKRAKQELAILEANFKQEKKAKLDDLKKTFSDSEVTELKEEFETDILSTELLSTAYKSKGFDHHVIQARRNNFLIERFLPLKYHGFTNYRAEAIQAEDSAT